MHILSGDYFMRRITGFLVAILILSTLGMGCTESTEESATESADITIGALLPVTGDIGSIGVASQTALEISSKDINNYFSGLGSDKHVEVIIRDTEDNPAKALEQLKALDEMGIKIVIGPQSSNNAKAVLDYAENNGIVLLSTASTAPSLAVADDNLFRLVPDDSNQGMVLATMMKEEKVDTVIPIYRNDTWGNGLSEETAKHFDGTVMEGIIYDSATEDFSAEVEALNEKVISATSDSDEDSVAVLLCSYEEVTEIFSLAGEYPALSNVKWYGSDGIALNEKLVEEEVAGFAVKTNLRAPIYGYEEENDRYHVVESRIEEELGRAPETYALAAYDALWLATFVDLDAVPENDESTKLAMNTLSDTYFGVTGWTKLDENGDRVHWDYDIWAISENDGNYEWKLDARYQVDPGEEGKLMYVE